MADQNGIPGSPLGDLFAGAAGANVNRPALNSFVATSQQRNGLYSAQTQDALIKAQQQQESVDAYNNIPAALKDAFPGMRDSETQLARDFITRESNGDPITALKAIGTLKLGYGQPAEQTAGQQMVKGQEAGPVQTPPNFQLPPGSPLANVPVQQSPEGAAQTAHLGAQTNLANAQANDPTLFHPGGRNGQPLDPVLAQEAAEFIRQNPNLAGNFRSLLSNGGPEVIHAFLHPQGGAPTLPANGIAPAPGVSLKEQADIRKDFASGTGARQATALNTMVQHSQLFDAIADQMGNGNFAPTNYINQLWQRSFGSPVPSNLKIAGDFLGREAVRATINAGSGTGQERELAVTGASSPDALHGAAQTLRSLAAGQLHSLDLRAQRGGVDIAQLLGPEARAAFGRNRVPVAQPPESATGGGGGGGGDTVPTAAAPSGGGATPQSLDDYLKAKGF